MDPSSRSSAALLDTNIAALLRRFENIIALAPDQKDRSLTANESYQMEVETAALIRAAEDLTALTRRLKELWLFGQLDTLGPSDAEGKAAERAREVAESIKDGRLKRMAVRVIQYDRIAGIICMAQAFKGRTNMIPNLIIATNDTLELRSISHTVPSSAVVPPALPKFKPASTSIAMPPSTLPLTLIVAATPSLGIGRAGTLPWPQLRNEMAYFARVTKRAGAAGGVNAVIMGRRTWDSIPTAFRPLRGRVNVVISRSLNMPLEWKLNKQGEHDGTGVLSASSLEEALKVLESWKEERPLSKVFVIGGAEIYRTALDLDNASRVLLTRIKTEFECDVHFPLKLGEVSGWEKSGKEALDEFTGEEVPSGVQSEKDVEWEFEMWTKVDKKDWRSFAALFNH